jgi:hypothetical protein
VAKKAAGYEEDCDSDEAKDQNEEDPSVRWGRFLQPVAHLVLALSIVWSIVNYI